MGSPSDSDLYARLYRLGVELAAERDRDRLIERILLEAKALCRADGGTLYLVDEDERVLRFAMLHTDSLELAYGGTQAEPVPMPPIPMFDAQTGEPNHANVATHCVHARTSVNVADAYDADGFDFAGTQAFDARTGYRSVSFLTIPMKNAEERVIGVLQLINATAEDGKVVAFDGRLQEAVEALAAQAAVALDNQMLLAQQKNLLDAFIQLIAAAIDSKSPYTGGHCRRVPMLTEMLTQAVCDEKDGPLAAFDLDEEGWYELHIAAWLHDCGKITTPVHVMDKSTKLETIFDRIEMVRTRLAVMRQEALRGSDHAEQLESKLAELSDIEAFLTRVNRGGEFMEDADRERISELAKRTWTDVFGNERSLLTEEEAENLRIRKGTLTEKERVVINGHMVETIRMLEALPFPRNLRQVPEYAGGHHERMDGNGYPKGLYAGDMSVPARIMAIADVFEALTASDRPYKPGMKLSQAMSIMGRMVENNHLDPELFRVFVRSGTYRAYAETFLDAEQIDPVDEAAVLEVRPRGFELPPQAERKKRWQGFLPAYQALIDERANGPGTPKS
ncbi:MAG TPA: HD domain-containing phosphohydrolase [Myxococcales bacterium LLY-WYZ-16_1]|nr:HD domain-containing phosphohydrolase [Myxococcales bacterium LLY-WYZ-16_1]